MPLASDIIGIGWASGVRAGKLDLLMWVRECRWADQLRHLQAQIQGIELVHLNIYLIDEQLERMKGPAPQIQNYRLSVTQGNTRRAERSPSEVPVLIGQRKPEALYQWLTTMNICKQRIVTKG